MAVWFVRPALVLAGIALVIGSSPAPTFGSSTPGTSPTPLTDAQVAALKAQMDKNAWDLGPTQLPTVALQRAIDAKYAAASTFTSAHMSVAGLGIAVSGVPASDSVIKIRMPKPPRPTAVPHQLRRHSDSAASVVFRRIWLMQ